MQNLQYYLDTFSVTPSQLTTLIQEGLAKGGDFCDLYFEYSTYMNLTLRDSQVSAGGLYNDLGVGIRVLKGEKTGYAYSESTEMADMIKAARAASTIAYSPSNPRSYSPASSSAYSPSSSVHSLTSLASASPIGPVGSVSLDVYENLAKSRLNLYPMELSWRETQASDLARALKSLEEAILSRDERVVKIIAVVSCSVSDVLMYNSLGELSFDSRPMGSLIASVVFHKDGKFENKTVSRSFRMGAEMISPELIDELATQAVKGIDERFEAIRPAGGKMAVVMGAGASGILLHEAIGHTFEADFNRKGQSIFSDKMGKQVCSTDISIVDDGTLPFNRGSGNYDDEGVPGQKTYMIKDGILTSYLHDRISSSYYGVAPTGNGRRENFRYNPIPRMRSTYMENGSVDPSLIIADVKQGIYVDEFSNGQVKIGEGDFTFFVKNGYLIENGRLGAPIKDINVIGNGPKALADIIAVGNDLIVDNGTWTCGKDQNVPVTCGLPTILVRSLIVGGE